MKRLAVALAFAAIGAVIFSIAYGQASIGDTRYLAVEFPAILICQAIALALLLPDLIPAWLMRIFRHLKEWLS